MKVPRRVGYTAGIKAGFVAGLVSLAFILTSNLVILYLSGLSRASLWRFFILVSESDIPFSIVVGLLLGIVFAATHDKFPRGIALELKGIMYGTGFWLLVILPNVLLLPTGQLFFSSGFFAVSITGYLILGLVLGTLYRRFSSKLENLAS